MRTQGEYIGATRTLEGDICISFAIDDDYKVLEQLEKLEGKELTIEAKKYSKKRSLNANAYFWKLCDQMARRLESNKDIIYLLQLKNYGVFDFVEVVKEGVKYLEPLYRFIDVDHEYTETREDNAGTEYLANMVAVKCYIGSSHYNSEQMSHLINGTVNDCIDLGIDVMTAEEIENLLLNWEGRDRYE